MTYSEFKKIATSIEIDDGEDGAVDFDTWMQQIEDDRKSRELGVGGAFVRSIPITLLIAGLSGLAVGLRSGSPAAGITTGLVTGGVTAGMNTYLNRHATPEEAGTSFFASL